MAHMSHVPPEILGHIFSELSSKQDLKNICLCSRAFYSIAVPYLYARILIHSRPGYEFPTEYTPTRSLALLLLERPVLAQSVRHIRIDTQLQRAFNNDDSLPEPERRLLEAAAANVSIARAQLAADHNDDLALSVLLPVLTRLEKLKLTSLMFQPRLQCALTSVVRPGSAFRHSCQRLHTARLHWITLKALRPEILSALLMLSAMRRVVISGFRGSGEDTIDEPYEGFRRQETRSSDVTHLELQGAWMSPADLDDIMRICRGLRTFVYFVGECGPFHANYAALRQSLDRHQETLETLWLGDVDAPYDAERTEGISFVPFESFAGFTKLKRLGLTLRHIFGYHDDDPGAVLHAPTVEKPIGWNRSYRRRLRAFFPPNIEVISIHGIKSEHRAILLHALTDLLEERPVMLKLIRFEVCWVLDRDSDPVSYWGSLAALERRCWRADVQFLVLHLLRREHNTEWMGFDHLWGGDERYLGRLKSIHQYKDWARPYIIKTEEIQRKVLVYEGLDQ